MHCVLGKKYALFLGKAFINFEYIIEIVTIMWEDVFEIFNGRMWNKWKELWGKLGGIEIKTECAPFSEIIT